MTSRALAVLVIALPLPSSSLAETVPVIAPPKVVGGLETIAAAISAAVGGTGHAAPIAAAVGGTGQAAPIAAAVGGTGHAAPIAAAVGGTGHAAPMAAAVGGVKVVIVPAGKLTGSGFVSAETIEAREISAAES